MEIKLITSLDLQPYQNGVLQDWYMRLNMPVTPIIPPKGSEFKLSNRTHVVVTDITFMRDGSIVVYCGLPKGWSPAEFNKRSLLRD